MKSFYLRGLALLLVSLLAAACASSHSTPAKSKRAASSDQAVPKYQTGSYIPARNSSPGRSGSTTQSKTPKAKKPKAKPPKATAREDDPDFVPRGGFR